MSFDTRWSCPEHYRDEDWNDAEQLARRVYDWERELNAIVEPMTWRARLGVALVALGVLAAASWVLYLAGLVVSGDPAWPATWWRG